MRRERGERSDRARRGGEETMVQSKGREGCRGRSETDEREQSDRARREGEEVLTLIS